MYILVAEDDVMLADCLTEALLDHGHTVCGVASSIAEAVILARQYQPDVAILDMQLGSKERGSDIALQLSKSGDLGHTGVLYVTGEAERMHQDVEVGHAYLAKPYTFAVLDAALEIVREIACEGGTSRPLPRGLQLLDAAMLSAHPVGADAGSSHFNTGVKH